jgi:hypothetical protein
MLFVIKKIDDLVSLIARRRKNESTGGQGNEMVAQSQNNDV